jgi:hypothetical protein
MAMTLTKKIQFLALLAAFALAACSGSGDEDDFGNSQIESVAEGGQGSAVRSTPIILPESFSGVLVEVTDSMHYQPKQFAEELAKQPTLESYASSMGDVAQFSQPIFRLAVNSRTPKMDQLFQQKYGNGAQWQIERYIFTYKTISSISGADTVLVGTVTFPNNVLPGKNHEVTTLTLHHHQAAFDESWLPSKSPTMMTLHALHNSAVIEPDFMGANSDIMTIVGLYLNGDIVGQQMLHCVMAAFDVMRNHGVKLTDDGYSNNWGSSLAMPSTLGLAQYMENEAPEEVANTVRMRATFVGEGITKFSHLGLIDPNQAPPTPSYKYNEGWNPQLPLYMSSCPNDNFVSYQALKDYCQELATRPDGTVNPDVEWIDFNVANTELQEKIGGNHFVAATLMLLYMSLAEDPADMKKLLR